MSRSFVEKLLHRRRTTGEIAALPHGGGRKSLCREKEHELVRRLIEQQPDATLDESCETGARKRNLQLSRPAMSRLLQRLDLKRKKSRSTPQNERPGEPFKARHRYRRIIHRLAVPRCKLIDESGVNISMTRLYGRAPKGHRVVGSIPQNWGRNITLLAALSVTEVDATMTVEGATDTDVFCADVSEVLAPTLAKGDNRHHGKPFST